MKIHHRKRSIHHGVAGWIYSIIYIAWHAALLKQLLVDDVLSAWHGMRAFLKEKKNKTKRRGGRGVLAGAGMP